MKVCAGSTPLLFSAWLRTAASTSTAMLRPGATGMVIIGTLCGVYFFYFSKKQEGLAKIPSKIGVYFLMISFGATLVYTVMARVSLLIGRLEFLLKDWLHSIN